MLLLCGSRRILGHDPYQFMRNIGLFQILLLFLCKLKIHSFCRSPDMVEFGGTYYRCSYLRQKPGQRNLCHRHAPLIGQLSHPVNDHLVLTGSIIVFQFCIAVLFKSLGSFPRVFGKTSSCQSAVRRHSNIVFCTELCHLPLFLAENQVIMPLYRNKLLETFLFRQRICLGKLVGKAVGNSDITGFSFFYDPVQAIHNIIERRLMIPHMVNIQIYIV